MRIDSALQSNDGAELRTLRDLAGCSLGQVCNRCGGVFDVPQLSRFERNQLSFSAAHVDLIKRVLRAEIRARRRRINEVLGSVPADHREKERVSV